MTKSARIRELSALGISTADIARQMGIRLQHAYNVLKQHRIVNAVGPPDKLTGLNADKPLLSEQHLLKSGFEKVAQWQSKSDGSIELSQKLPVEGGVYAFCIDGVAHYVGLASMGLSKRIYFYARPGITQRTSIRLNRQIIDCLSKGQVVDVLIARPSDLEWNGLPVHVCAGLELGLIKAFTLLWNQRSTK